MSKLSLRKELLPFKTIIVKIGSRILTAPGGAERIEGLVEDCATLHASGIRVVVVSSGAIAHGMQALRLTKRPTTIPLQQACASVGQNRLMNVYQACFARHDILIGQVLLTWDDLRSKKRYLNLRNTMFQLLEHGIIPIVNENDSVGVDEIRFGTNDILGAQMAILAQAEVFVNLTDVGGLFDRNPLTDPGAVHIPLVRQMSDTLQKLAADRTSEISVGGMSSKLKAAEIVMRAGIFCIVGDGFSHRLSEVLGNESCSTVFLPSTKKMSSRRSWMAFSGMPQGSLTLDEGAVSAIIDKGKSLLPAGVKSIGGSFKAGDNVDLRTPEGVVVARGLVNYSADDLRRILGCKTADIAGRIGRKEFDEAVHRDNLVVL
jgi:glutamate 5-kinase